MDFDKMLNDIEGAAYQAHLDAEADAHECDSEGWCGCAEDAADADRDLWY